MITISTIWGRSKHLLIYELTNIGIIHGIRAFSTIKIFGLNFKFEQRGKKILKKLGAFVLLFVLWVLLSGIFDPLLFFFGSISAVMVIIITHRMDKTDNYPLTVKFNIVEVISYFFWLISEIVKANLQVVKIIITNRKFNNQKVFKVKSTQFTDVAQVLFANSITLTPGTITIETEKDHLLVHALDYSKEQLQSLKIMDKKVTKLEEKSIL